MELLKGLNFCDLKICEEFLKERSDYMVLLELYKSNELHREALQLLNQLVEKSKYEMENTDFNKKFSPHMIIEYLRVQFIFPLLVFNWYCLSHKQSYEKYPVSAEILYALFLGVIVFYLS